MKEERYADVRTYLPFLEKREGMAQVLERSLGISQVRQLFEDSAHEDNPFKGVVRRLNLEIEMQNLAHQVPAEGPVVFVANHAFGGADAVALAAIMREYRADMKILANEEVTRLAGVRKWMIPVSLLSGEQAAGRNTSSLRAMLKHVRDGGCLGVFPAGRVAFWQKGAHREPEWNRHVVKLLQRMDARVIPIWFFGAPPAWIRIGSVLSPFVRTALITRGLVSMKNSKIVARAGKAFSSRELRDLGDEGSDWLRRKLEQIRESGN